MDLYGFRLTVGASQTDVADATGISQATICRIENGVHRPAGLTLLAIQRWADETAKAKRVPVAQRLTWEWLEQGGA